MSDNPNVVIFDFTDWTTAYPKFAYLTSQQGQAYFSQACVLINNTPFSPIPLMDCGGNLIRSTILYAATAHIAQLFAVSASGVQPAQSVGRVASATEGSVTVALDMGQQPRSAAWWNQTPAGAMAWSMMAPYRMARYFARPQRYLGTAPPGVVGGFRGPA